MKQQKTWPLVEMTGNESLYSNESFQSGLNKSNMNSSGKMHHAWLVVRKSTNLSANFLESTNLSANFLESTNLSGKSLGKVLLQLI